MWCSYHKNTTHSDVDCRARPANTANANAHFAQVRPPSDIGIFSSWDLPVRDDSDKKPYISLSAREVQLQPSPPKSKWNRRGPGHWAQPRQKRRSGGALALAHLFRVLSRPFFCVGPVAEETLIFCCMVGTANDEEPVEKALRICRPPPFYISIIGARTCVHIKYSRNLDAVAWKGKVCGYSEKNKFFRVWNPKTRRVVENATFMNTRPHWLPQPSHLFPLQDLVPPSWYLDDDAL